MPRAAVLALVLVAGCGPSEPRAPDLVEAPRDSVRAWLVASTAPSWALGRSDYNLDDPALLDSLVDATNERQPRPLGLEAPAERRDLDRLATLTQGRYINAMIASPARRAAVEARLLERYETAEVAWDGREASMDLGLAPARFVPRRTSWGLETAQAYGTRGELSADAVARAFGRLAEAHPDAEVLSFTVEVVTGTVRSPLRYAYVVGSDALSVEASGGTAYDSAEPVGGLEALVSGRASTRTADLEMRCQMEWC